MFRPIPMPLPPNRRLDSATPLVAAFVAYFGWYVWWLFAVRHGVADAGQDSLWSTLTGVPLDVAPIFFAWRAATRPTLDAQTRRAWRLLTVAFVGPATVSALWVAYGSTAQITAFPAWVKVLNYWHYAFALWALAIFPRSFRPGYDRTTFLLDASIVLLSGAVLSWHLVFRDVLSQIDADALTTLYTLGTPTANLVVLFGLAAFLLRRPQRESQGAVAALAAGFLVLLVSDSLFVQARVLHQPVRGGWLDALYALGGLLWVFAGYLQNVGAGGATSELQQRARSESMERRLKPYSLMPYAAIAGVYAVLLVQAHRVEHEHGRRGAAGGERDSDRGALLELVIGAITVTAIVAARQLSAQRKNVELVAERLAREAHFRALVQHASDVMLVLDAGGVVREASPAVGRVLGHQPPDLVGRPFPDLVLREDAELVRADLSQLAAAVANGNATSAPCEWRVRHASGGFRWLEVLCTNLLHDPSVQGIVVNGRDVSERKALEVELRHRAFYDPLTNLCNRARFHAEVMDALLHGRPQELEGGAHRLDIAVLYIDLDGFKPVNDAFGHAVGDQVLQTVAERLLDATRGTDVVARLGGDEFAALLGRLGGPADVEVVAERIVSAVARPIDVNGVQVTVGASVGIACATPYAAVATDGAAGRSTQPHTASVISVAAAEALLRAADRAMYQAKARGGGCYAFSADRTSVALRSA